MNWYTTDELREMKEAARFVGACVGYALGFLCGAGFALFLYGLCK